MTYPELRVRIEEEFGRKVESKEDLEDLADSINDKIGEHINVKTLAEIFEIELD